MVAEGLGDGGEEVAEELGERGVEFAPEGKLFERGGVGGEANGEGGTGEFGVVDERAIGTRAVEGEDDGAAELLGEAAECGGAALGEAVDGVEGEDPVF